MILAVIDKCYRKWGEHRLCHPPYTFPQQSRPSVAGFWQNKTIRALWPFAGPSVDQPPVFLVAPPVTPQLSLASISDRSPSSQQLNKSRNLLTCGPVATSPGSSPRSLPGLQNRATRVLPNPDRCALTTYALIALAIHAKRESLARVRLCSHSQSNLLQFAAATLGSLGLRSAYRCRKIVQTTEAIRRRKSRQMEEARRQQRDNTVLCPHVEDDEVCLVLRRAG
jgi:hypothetical protein